MPGYYDTYTGCIPEGATFRFNRHSTPCCPHCGSPEFDLVQHDKFKPSHFGLARVHCHECGAWARVHELVELYESDYEFQEA